jgi:hypothetical protein
MEVKMEERVTRLMEGAYDTHTHAMPGISPSKNTILEIVKEAKSFGMAGIVFKDINYSTAPQAAIVTEVVQDIKTIGGVTLSASLGGVNPFAVEASFKMGGKVVWMFALDSAFQVKQMFAPGYPFPMEHNRNMLVPVDTGGYSIFKEGTEELMDEAREIVALCKKYDGVLETSHLSPEEAFAIIKEGKNQGLERMVVTHANSTLTPYTTEQQKAFIELGATINFSFEPYLSRIARSSLPMSDLAKLIRLIGVENVTLGTDVGASFWPSPVECIRIMIASFVIDKFTDEEIKLMVSVNPDRIYGQ